MTPPILLAAALAAAQTADDREAAPAAEPTAVADSAAPAAATPELGNDRVRLKSGGRIRGQIVETVPGSHVTVLVLGEQRRVAWEEIDGVDEGHFSPGARAPADPAPGAKAPLPDVKGAPFVTLRSTGRKRLQLQQIEREGVGSGYGYWGAYSVNMMQWRSTCSEPCERRIDARKGETFVVGDNALTFSKRFTLDQEQGDVVIEGRPGNKAARIAGVVGLGVGLGLVLSSPLMFLFDDNQVEGFAIMLGVGGALSVAGTFGLVYGRARVKVKPMNRRAAKQRQRLARRLRE